MARTKKNPDTVSPYMESYAHLNDPLSYSTGGSFSDRGYSRLSKTGKNSQMAGELDNIRRGVSPFNVDNTGINVSDAIYLCQKAYWNIAIFRSTIDIQTEFANSRLHFRGKNKRSVKFFKEWYKKINGQHFGEQFIREWFRSGNVFTFKFFGDLTFNDVRKMSRSDASTTKKIPLRYTILNPTELRCSCGSSFLNAKYSKILTPYEIKALKDPKTEDDIAFKASLTPEQRKQIDSGEAPTFELTSDKLMPVFCGKQDYEALAIPMYYPVLFDIDLKLEFKKVEKVVARTSDYIVFLVTAGDEERGAINNAKIIKELQTLFLSETVGRVIVSDFSTKGEFLIPDLNKIFGYEKYRAVNDDIANGLMNIFWGEEKYANSLVKIQVFLERLESAREAYLNQFLIPEMERIAKDLGFGEIPEIQFETINLKNDLEYKKLFTRLAELGLLTADETIDAFNDGVLPIKEDSRESQEEFKKLKDNGLYSPLVGGNKEAGRPEGTKAPQTTKKVGPIGTGSYKLSLSRISDNVRKFETLVENVEAAFREKHSIKRLTNKQKEMCYSIAEVIASQRHADSWHEDCKQDVANYNPGISISDEVEELAEEHKVSYAMAAVLQYAKV